MEQVNEATSILPVAVGVGVGSAISVIYLEANLLLPNSSSDPSLLLTLASLVGGGRRRRRRNPGAQFNGRGSA